MFNDFVNYEGYEQHAMLALFEFQNATGWAFEVLAAPCFIDWDRSPSSDLRQHDWWLRMMRAVAIELRPS